MPHAVLEVVEAVTVLASRDQRIAQLLLHREIDEQGGDKHQPEADRLRRPFTHSSRVVRLVAPREALKEFHVNSIDEGVFFGIVEHKFNVQRQKVVPIKGRLAHQTLHKKPRNLPIQRVRTKSQALVRVHPGHVHKLLLPAHNITLPVRLRYRHHSEPHRLSAHVLQSRVLGKFHPPVGLCAFDWAYNVTDDAVVSVEGPDIHCALRRNTQCIPDE
mmetsp:Transcript_49878/g.121731  ORF Transcript_49878/g.121731 Transcript_49878/m.121731 type:complete len:216 (-) Transcript_49878:548-1195(-)